MGLCLELWVYRIYRFELEFLDTDLNTGVLIFYGLNICKSHPSIKRVTCQVTLFQSRDLTLSIVNSLYFPLR